MNRRPKFCQQCGAAMTVRDVEDRRRDVCSECGEVLYRNPLPVAAAVLLNDQREVLLVKRKSDPRKGTWCLPTGFAELGESIHDAALRELQEETGNEGKVLTLLDASSMHDEQYGDLLFVTFLIERTGGTEAAGDDAQDLRYFPLDCTPPLAFAPHDRALASCSEHLRDQWAIADSFRDLGLEQGGELLSDTLVGMVRDHADEIVSRWLEVVSINPSTPHYVKLNQDLVAGRALKALSSFRHWLAGEEAGEEIRLFYLALGRERKNQDFAVGEVISALTFLRREIWDFARERGLGGGPLDVYRVMELSRRVVLFFDKAIYYTIIGFGGEK